MLETSYRSHGKPRSFTWESGCVYRRLYFFNQIFILQESCRLMKTNAQCDSQSNFGCAWQSCDFCDSPTYRPTGKFQPIKIWKVILKYVRNFGSFVIFFNSFGNFESILFSQIYCNKLFFSTLCCWKFQSILFSS